MKIWNGSRATGKVFQSLDQGLLSPRLPANAADFRKVGLASVTCGRWGLYIERGIKETALYVDTLLKHM